MARGSPLGGELGRSGGKQLRRAEAYALVTKVTAPYVGLALMPLNLGLTFLPGLKVTSPLNHASSHPEGWRLNAFNDADRLFHL